MCPSGALLGPRSNGPSYSNPGYYSDNPSCPCYCPVGIYWDGIKCATSPIQCAIGYYMSGSTCIQCPTGLTTPTVGATSISQCVCVIGYYMSGSTCIQCTAGKTTQSTGATSVSQCGKPIILIISTST